jgi:tetratricopeptide (TPR) repeat protein
VQAGNFENNAEGVFEKVWRWLFGSSREKNLRGIYAGLSANDPVAAQNALNALLRDYPELKDNEPQAIKYHQGMINFSKGDLAGAYKELDEAIKELEPEFHKGFPRGEYWERNTNFMAKLYFNRGVTQLRQKKYQPALADIDLASRISTQPRAYMYLNKSRALLMLKRYKDAAVQYDLAYRTNPPWVSGLEDKASICAVLSQNGFIPQPCVPAK